MSPLRRKILGLLVAPLGTALAAGIGIALGPHLLVGCLAGFLPAFALAVSAAPFGGVPNARAVILLSTSGFGLGGATALVYWQVARPDVA